MLRKKNVTFFALKFSLSYAQNIVLLPIVLILTYFQHKHVPVVLVSDYCILLTEENSKYHKYVYLRRMVYKFHSLIAPITSSLDDLHRKEEVDD